MARSAPTGADHAASAGRGDDTRERILDAAQRLFAAQGYARTSLREIAGEMGFTKAALYYHFASKEEILLALHLRMHEIGRQAFRRLGEAPSTPAAWSALLQELAGDMLAQRDLLILHTRDQAALANLAGRHQHDREHRDMETMAQATLADASLPTSDRVRLGTALGAIFGVVTAGDAFSDIPVECLLSEVRAVIRDILGPAGTGVGESPRAEPPGH